MVIDKLITTYDPNKPEIIYFLDTGIGVSISLQVFNISFKNPSNPKIDEIIADRAEVSVVIESTKAYEKYISVAKKNPRSNKVKSNIKPDKLFWDLLNKKEKYSHTEVKNVLFERIFKGERDGSWT